MLRQPRECVETRRRGEECGGETVCVHGGPQSSADRADRWPGRRQDSVFLGLVRQSFCSHVRVLSEAAGVVFGGGFPREDSAGARRAAQRAIFHLQRGLESVAGTDDAAIVLCDRGTIDGIAYWPGPSDFWSSVGTSEEKELGRDDAVIHLRTPSAVQGYNHENPLRIESAAAAAEVDERILAARHDYPRRWVVESSPDFFDESQAGDRRPSWRNATVLRTARVAKGRVQAARCEEPEPTGHLSVWA